MILGTPFLTQIYPFHVNSEGIHTNVLGKEMTFKFVTSVSQKDIHLLQSSTISQQINQISSKRSQIKMLKDEISYLRIEEQLQRKDIQQKIKEIEERFQNEICSDVPNAFWERKKHVVYLPYEKDFSERNIPTKARPIQMNQELLEFCKKEIQTLLDKKLIRPSKSPWSCSAFYVNNQRIILTSFQNSSFIDTLSFDL